MQDARSGSRRPERPGRDRGADPSAAGTPLTLQASPTVSSTSQDPSTSLWDRAFPAAWWRPVLAGRPVTVRVEGGAASLRGARNGRALRLGPIPEGRRELTADDLEADWLWIEGDATAVTWSIAAEATLPPVTVVVPTYRREADARRQADRFARMDVVTTVVVIDQGGTLAEDAAFTRLCAASDAIRLVSQENLGGSGGYARGMLEAADDPGAAVLFSDDDAVLSEESLRRMLTYQALADRPTILGTPLFSSVTPSYLVAHAESVRTGIFQWKPADSLGDGVDLAGTTPEQWTFLSPASAVNYTGWWGTLFPPGTVADLGLPAPLFLKWDDAEYGLRATAHGYAHAVLPGTSVHHPPWNAYRTQMTWTARVLHRNRLAIAAAYGAGRGVIGSSLLHQTKHILAGHLLTAELWQEGITAFRAGPDAWLGSDLHRARTEGAQVAEAWHTEHDVDDGVTPTRTAPLPLLPAVVRALVRMLRPDRPPRVVLAVDADAVHWRTTMGADTVIITEDGRPLTAFTVRGSDARRALVRTASSHLDLAVNWGRLRRRYHRTLPRHTTADSWAALIGTDRATGARTPDDPIDPPRPIPPTDPTDPTTPTRRP